MALVQPLVALLSARAHALAALRESAMATAGGCLAAAAVPPWGSSATVTANAWPAATAVTWLALRLLLTVLLLAALSRLLKLRNRGRSRQAPEAGPASCVVSAVPPMAPEAWPLVGHLFSLCAFDHHEWFTRMASALGPAYRAWSPGRIYYVITSPRAVRAILGPQGHHPKNPHIYVSFGEALYGQRGRGASSLLCALDDRDPGWRRRRKALAGAFDSASIRASRGLVAAKCEELASILEVAAARNEVVDVDALMIQLTLDVMGQALFHYEFRALSGGGPGRAMMRALACIMRDYIVSATGAFWRRWWPFDALIAERVAAKRARADLLAMGGDLLDASRRAAADHEADAVATAADGGPAGGGPGPSSSDWLPSLDSLPGPAAPPAAPAPSGSPARPWPPGAARGPPPPGSLIGRLLALTDDRGHGATREQLVAEIVTFALAGHDTTGHTAAYAVYAVSVRPHIEARLHAELDGALGDPSPGLAAAGSAAEGDAYGSCSTGTGGGDRLLPAKLPYLNAVIKETLRYYPMLPDGSPRVADRELLIEGRFKIPKGAWIMIPGTALMRSANSGFERPGEFWPERWLPAESGGGASSTAEVPGAAAFLPFSFGPRDCVGQPFAMSELRSVLALLLHRFVFRPTAGFELRHHLQAAATLQSDAGVRMTVARRGKGRGSF